MIKLGRKKGYGTYFTKTSNFIQIKKSGNVFLKAWSQQTIERVVTKSV